MTSQRPLSRITEDSWAVMGPDSAARRDWQPRYPSCLDWRGIIISTLSRFLSFSLRTFSPTESDFWRRHPCPIGGHMTLSQCSLIATIWGRIGDLGRGAQRSGRVAGVGVMGQSTSARYVGRVREGPAAAGVRKLR